jgi:cob(I)alamin adenosyltransferase
LRLTKIYTKIGDKGTTLLADGSTVQKNSARICCYGNVDELNSFVGCLKDAIDELEIDDLNPLSKQLKMVQNELFDVGGELSTPQKVLNIDKQQVVSTETIKRLENEIDTMNSSLAPLENFVLPGGHRANSLAHVCRTICRRTERSAIELSGITEVRTEPQIFLNRLSDWFFVVGRYISFKLEIPETTWDQNKK